LNIRCERCSTTYELDEALLAPEGSPVQCTKCQHVFTAVPPRAAGRTLVGVPAAPPPKPSAPRPHAPEPQGGAPRQGPAIYRPSGGAAPGGARAPRPRRDTMGAFEARLKANARLRWLIPIVGVALVVAVLGAWALLARRVDPAALRRHSEAMALVALDDVESLEKAARALDDLAAGKSRIPSIEADRSLCQLLLASGLLEDVALPAQRLAARVAERDRLRALQPPPAPELLSALNAELEALRSQVEPRQAAARGLSERAYGALKQQSAEGGGENGAARALAIHFASTGDRDQALRFIRAAGGTDRDPWIQLADGWLDAREEGKEARERAVSKLSALVGAHPEIVRARYLLARTQAALGRREVAAATLDGLLTANPRHQRASRLRAELVAAVAPALPAAAPRPAPLLAPPPPGGTLIPPPAPAMQAPATAPAAPPKPAAPAAATVPPPRPAIPVAPALAPPRAGVPGAPAPAPVRPVAPSPAPPSTVPANAPGEQLPGPVPAGGGN